MCRVLLLIILFAVVCTFSFVPQEPRFEIPCLAWSGKDYFLGEKQLVSSDISSTDLSNLFESIITQTPKKSAFSPYLKSVNQKPELVILFLAPNLRTDELSHPSLSFLKSFYLQSRSSLLAPHSHLFQNGETLTDEALKTSVKSVTAQDGRVVYAGVRSSIITKMKNVASIKIKDIDTYATQKKLFTNGVADLIVVSLDTDNLQTVIQIVSLVSERTEGNYVALFTGERPSIPDITWSFGAKRSFEGYTFEETNTTNITNSTETGWDWFHDHFPGWFWEGFIIVIALLIVAGTGLFMLSSLQAHDKYETQRRRRAME